MLSKLYNDMPCYHSPGILDIAIKGMYMYRLSMGKLLRTGIVTSLVSHCLLVRGW